MHRSRGIGSPLRCAPSTPLPHPPPLFYLAQATPFLVGCGVAAAAYAARGAILVGQRLQQNPETMKTAQAAAAGFRAVGDSFRLSAFTDRIAQMRGGSACGFEATMTRREAAKILGEFRLSTARNRSHVHLATGYSAEGCLLRHQWCLCPAGVKESASKAHIKEAHRKVMLLNHPDRGGSPYIASKINQASEVMMGQDRSSGSAFS
eukprot:scaffold6344_cov27-Tisochrysis_lutea.AAC.2